MKNKLFKLLLFFLANYKRCFLMKIDLLDSRYVFGCCRTEETKHGIFFHRMSPELEEIYKYSEAAEIRAMNTAGVRISFVSDTSSLSISGTFGRVSREIYSFDMIVDEKEMITLKPEAAKPEIFCLKAVIPGTGSRKIEIFLPNMAETFINSIEIDDGSELEPAARPKKKWLFLGDSITQGVIVSSPALSYAARSARAIKYDWHNLAVGGAVMKKEVGEMALGIEWNVVSIAYGVNDFAQNIPLERLENELKGLLRALSSRKNSKIFVITPIPWVDRSDSNGLGLSLEEYRKSIAVTALSFNGVAVIDGLRMVPDDNKYFVDKVHPNDEGMRVFSENLLPKIS